MSDSVCPLFSLANASGYDEMRQLRKLFYMSKPTAKRCRQFLPLLALPEIEGALRDSRRAADKILPPLTLPSPPLSRCAGGGEGTFESAARPKPCFLEILVESNHTEVTTELG